jgi:hypothetical protein
MSGLNKFASESVAGNKFGIVNSRGEVVTMEYLRRYLHCWCRVADGFVSTKRHEIIEHYMSDAVLTRCKGMTASQIGKACSLDPRWNRRIPVDKRPAADTTPMSSTECYEDTSSHANQEE